MIGAVLVIAACSSKQSPSESTPNWPPGAGGARIARGVPGKPTGVPDAGGAAASSVPPAGD